MYLSRSIAFDFMGCVRPAAKSSPALVEGFHPPACLDPGRLGTPVVGERSADGSRTITYDTGFRVTRRTGETGNTTVTVHDPAGWLVEEKVYDRRDDLVHLVSIARDGSRTTMHTQELSGERWTGRKVVSSGDDVSTDAFRWDGEADAWVRSDDE